MSERTAPRPPQVTFGGWVILVGSIFVLTSVYDTIATLRSIDTRESVEKMLSEPPLEGTGISFQSMLDMMHGAALVAGACAAATAILGGYVLRRQKSARLGVTILAIPLFLAGMVSGGFASSMVAVSAILLWTRPARDWFDGRTPQPRPTAARAENTAPQRQIWPPAGPPQSSPDQQATPHTHDSADSTPRSFSGFGSAPTTAARQGAVPRPANVRPRELVAACVLTWTFSALVLITMLMGLVVFVADDALIKDMYESDTRFNDAGVTVASLRTTALITCSIFAIWALFALVLGALAYVGQNWARWTLLVSAIATALLSLLLMVAAPVVLIVTGVAAYVAVLLSRPPVNRWMTRSSSPIADEVQQ